MNLPFTNTKEREIHTLNVYSILNTSSTFSFCVHCHHICYFHEGISSYFLFCAFVPVRRIDNEKLKYLEEEYV